MKVAEANKVLLFSYTMPWSRAPYIRLYRNNSAKEQSVFIVCLLCLIVYVKKQNKAISSQKSFHQDWNN